MAGGKRRTQLQNFLSKRVRILQALTISSAALSFVVVSSFFIIYFIADFQFGFPLFTVNQYLLGPSFFAVAISIASAVFTPKNQVVAFNGFSFLSWVTALACLYGLVGQNGYASIQCIRHGTQNSQEAEEMCAQAGNWLFATWITLLVLGLTYFYNLAVELVCILLYFGQEAKKKAAGMAGVELV
jgi:hypothetical protein